MTVSTRAQIMQNLAAGKGILVPFETTAGASVTTTQNAGSGFSYCQIQPNNIGSTLQSTLQSFGVPPGLPECFLQFLNAGSGSGNVRGVYLARLYKIGTVNLGATGDQFTHDSATFPMLRTQLGQSNQPIGLLPLLQVTTAPTVTAPAVRLETVAGGTGYVDQDGNNETVPVATLTLPSATTVLGTCYFLKLNAPDSAVRDVVAVRTVTAGTSSPAATVWGVELLCPLFMYNSNIPNYQDCLSGGLNAVDLAPATPTSGTATSVLALIQFGGSADQWIGWICGALNS